MLTDTLFVQQTIFTNALYLRMLRQYCLNLQLSFYDNNREYTQTAEVLRLKCEEIGKLLATYADGNLPEEIFGNHFLVTEYTLATEELTEKLFDVKLDIDITKKELEIKPGINEKPDQKTIAMMMWVNRMALSLTRNFIDFCEDIHKKMMDQELFAYSYPSMLRYMIETATLYETQLLRIISKQVTDPTYVTDYEYWFNTAMKDSATFIRGLVNPKNDDIYVRAHAFVNQFDLLLDEYKTLPLSPQNQKLLMEKSLNTVNRYRTLLQYALTETLNGRAYFIVEPTFLDTLYAEANYFKYILTTNLKQL